MPIDLSLWMLFFIGILSWVKPRLIVSAAKVQFKSAFIISNIFHWKWQSLVRRWLWFTNNVNPWHPITVNKRSCSRTLQNDPTCLHFLLKTNDRMNLKFILQLRKSLNNVSMFSHLNSCEKIHRKIIWTSNTESILACIFRSNSLWYQVWEWSAYMVAVIHTQFTWCW